VTLLEGDLINPQYLCGTWKGRLLCLCLPTIEDLFDRRMAQALADRNNLACTANTRLIDMFLNWRVVSSGWPQRAMQLCQSWFFVLFRG
jgi:hypothetical protein